MKMVMLMMIKTIHNLCFNQVTWYNYWLLTIDYWPFIILVTIRSRGTPAQQPPYCPATSSNLFLSLTRFETLLLVLRDFLLRPHDMGLNIYTAFRLWAQYIYTAFYRRNSTRGRLALILRLSHWPLRMQDRWRKNMSKVNIFINRQSVFVSGQLLATCWESS